MAGLSDALGLNGRQQWALFKVRGKLALRQFSRQPGKLLGVIIAAIFILPVVIGLSVASYIGYQRLPDQWSSALLGGILTLLWIIWILFPVVFFSLNEGLDVRKLLVYPLPRRDLAASVVLGTLFDYPTYVMLPLLAAVLVGWGMGAALPVVLLAVILAYAHMVLASQLVVTVFGGVLQSRRFRDVAIVIFSLVGSSCYFINLGFQELAERLDPTVFNEERLLAWRPLDTLQWLPPGAAARAIERADAGQWGESLLWLGYAAVLLAVVTWVWWRLMARLATGEGFVISGRAPKEEKPAARKRTAVGPGWLGWLPPDIAQLTIKELQSAWRIPQRRVGLIQGALLPIFMVVPFLATSGLPQTIPAAAGLALPLYIMFSLWLSGQNMLGYEGTGLPTLLLTPVPRQRIFLAKSLALILLALPVLLVLSIGAILAIDSWTAVVGALVSPAVMLVILAITSVFSVRFPFPINLEKASGGSSLSGGGCLTAVANLFVPIFIAIFSVPLLAGPVVAYWQGWPWLAYLSLPLGYVYAGLIFWFGTRWAGSWLLEREPEVIKATQVEKGK